MKTMKFKIVTHYCVDDVEFDGDYTGIELFDGDGNLIEEYGDWYHDKGQVIVEGFLEGVSYATGQIPDVEYVKVADYE